jgi:cell division transport system ATP-binding protein
MISCKQISKKYPDGVIALNEINFTLPSGGMAFLTGHSGAGKSTLLKLLTLTERPSTGQLIVGDTELTRMPNRKIPKFRQTIGVVFQNHLLLHDRTVYENVALPLYAAGYPQKDIKKRVHAALDTVQILDKARAMPQTLSGGEQQRVGIARAVINRPQVLVADEPTGNLDFELAQNIIQLFERFNKVGVTVLIATHNTALIEASPHPVLCLSQGRLIFNDIEKKQHERT